MRTILLILLSLLWMAATTAGAEAHAFLEHAAPRVGSTVDVPPAELRLQFSEAVEPKFSTVGLAAKDGGTITVGPAALDPQDPRVLVVAVPARLVPGVYRVTWRVVSRDTHVTTGDFTFEVGR
jgi:copper resistance protein C